MADEQSEFPCRFCGAQDFDGEGHSPDCQAKALLCKIKSLSAKCEQDRYNGPAECRAEQLIEINRAFDSRTRAVCDALAEAQRDAAMLAEVKNLQKGMLRYIAFLLTCDETADPTLAAYDLRTLARTLAQALVCRNSTEPIMLCADEAAFRTSRQHAPCECAPCRLWRSDGVQALLKD